VRSYQIEQAAAKVEPYARQNRQRTKSSLNSSSNKTSRPAFANEKARGHPGGAGSAILSDDANMPVICPTSQIFRKMRQ
jgi:hypothetical protein